MKILVACEESQAVTIELRRLGHEAYSCDINLNAKRKPPTNADRIRSMTDEELAEFLIDLADDGNLRIREWLQQTAGEEDKHEP